MKTKQEIFDHLVNLHCMVTPCGSRVTCDPAPTDTDEDYLLSVHGIKKQNLSNVVVFLESNGFINESDSEHYQDQAESTFVSMRRDEVNLIISTCPDFVKSHKLATAVCKELNLMDKHDRIVLFQAFLYGTAPK